MATKYLHANSSCSTAVWYTLAVGGSITTEPVTGDLIDTNGFTLTIDEDTAPFSAPSAYARLSPMDLLDIMKDSLGGKNMQAAAKTRLIKNAIVRAADYIWYWRGWSWRCLPYDLTTVASQAYTTLPSDFRSARIVKELWFNDDPLLAAQFIRSDMWTHRQRIVAYNVGATGIGRPEYCTVSLRDVSGSDVFVVNWSPTPDAIYTVKGFEYFKSIPTIDFTSTDPVFPESEFDILWQAKAYSFALNMGLEVGDATDNQRMMSSAEFKVLLTQAADRWAVSDATSLPMMPEDLRGDLADFASNEQGII